MVNGRTVAEDMEREYERAALRDHFAAAALTGLLAQGDDGSFSEESYARAAYRWADTMLRERDNQPAPPCVETDGFSSGSRPGPINRTPERQSPDRECGESSLRDVSRPDTKGKAAGGPEQNTQEPVAWAVTIGPAGKTEVYEAFAAHQKDEAIRLANQCRFGDAEMKWPLAPLYFTPTLTDEERQAIAGCIAYDEAAAATLRKLLERLA